MNHLFVPIDKAKYLAREINETVHAGGMEAELLNDLIATAEDSNSETVAFPNAFKNPLVDLYYFFDKVGMLDE